MKAQIIKAEFTRKELQEIGIALMGRSNILAETRGDGNAQADKEYAELQPLVEKVLAILAQ